MKFFSLLFLCLLIVFTVKPVVAASEEVDLMKGQDWAHMAGSSVEADGVHVTRLDRKIVNQDGSGGQPNPPVNTYGPRLSVSGNFSIKADIKRGSGRAILRFYGRLPHIYDEWRAETPSLSITMSGSQKLVAQIWDGKSDEPIEVKDFDVESGNEIQQLKVERHGGWLSFFVDGQLLGKLRDHKIFASKTLWFGLDNSSDKDWVLQDLRANGLGSGQIILISQSDLQLPHDDEDSLRNLAASRDRPLLIGAAVASGPLMGDDNYRSLAVNQFSIFTPENDFKPQFVHPAPQIYSFEDGDNIVELARANDIGIHGHALVFGEANPRWMQATPIYQRQQVMVDHIANVVGHYRGQVVEWDVVNEPLSDDLDDYKNHNGLRRHLWWQAMGEGYIDLAFRTAHQADPNTQLYLNDYGLEFDGQRWEALLGLLSRLKSDGVPIDGVGFQAHIYRSSDQIDPQVLSRHIQILKQLGLKARISEMDVHGGDKLAQSKQYSEVLEACQSEPNCTSFTTWGISDLYGSTTSLHTYPLAFGNNLIWSANFRPKPVFRAMQAVLNE
ncbi:MAG TPA: endo-1,4-beta-xylanase [Patescibacteria group bacterium]|nr:endo-1,4-beta-xylanase [Patescibacteria group bacterium]